MDAFLDDEQWDTGTVCASDVSPVGYTCSGPLLSIADEESCTIVASTCNDVAGIAATSTDVAGVASTSRHCHLTEKKNNENNNFNKFDAKIFNFNMVQSKLLCHVYF